MYKIERLIKRAEKELKIVKKFCAKYDLQVNYVKFFADRLNLELRPKKQ